MPVLRRLVARQVRPGTSLNLLAPAPLPDDLRWAQTDPIIADAYGRAAATFEKIGHRTLPDEVRTLVAARLAAWRGEEPGPSRQWVETAIATLPTPYRPLGRLTLLAALAPYQLDNQVIDDARTRPGPADDETLIAATAWSSFAAARRIGSWLHTTPARASAHNATTEP